MAKTQETKTERFYRVTVPKIINFGAAVVIVGALFKIMHYPGSQYLLPIGLGLEAFLFLLGVFQPPAPPEAHYEWEKVYPELAAAQGLPARAKDGKKEIAALGSIDKMLAESNLSADAFKDFGSGIKALNTSVSQIKSVSDVASASNQYTKSLTEASASMGNLNKAFAGTVTAMNTMAAASKDAKDYQMQLQSSAKNLAALNQIYDSEIKDANSHLKAMNKFYANLTGAMTNMTEASRESDAFRKQVSSLTTNLTSLNKVYGNMLTAMKG